MILHITRKPESGKAVYRCQEIAGIEGNANFTMGVALKRASVARPDGGPIVIAEKYLPLKILCRIFANLIWLCPLEFFIDGKAVRVRPFPFSFIPKLTFRLDGNAYEIRLHSGSNVSLTQDGRQIARYKKRNISGMEQNDYSVYYCGDADTDLLFTLCVLIDMLWFKDDASFKAVRKEKTVVLFDRCRDRADWLPEEK